MRREYGWMVAAALGALLAWLLGAVMWPERPEAPEAPAVATRAVLPAPPPPVDTAAPAQAPRPSPAPSAPPLEDPLPFAPMPPATLEEMSLTAAIEGVVRTPDGRPVEDALITGVSCLVGVTDGASVAPIYTDRDGRYAGRAMIPLGMSDGSDESARCELYVLRQDGAFSRREDPVAITLPQEGTVRVDFIVPDEPIGGMGISIGEHDQGILVMRVQEGTPAEAAGLQAGEVIVEVDGVSTTDIDVDEFVRLGTGAVGSEVEIVVLNTDGGERTVTLVRERVE
ncbi:MAG: PDZ domain-containing protein [Alphaproteobacteria bacterium]|nr:PDZ domain-containing protein [Alphaproteobacteria bacterium]